MKMKKNAFVRMMMLLFLLLTSSSMFAAGTQYLRITEKGGTIYEIPLSEYPIINVENNVLKVGASTIIYMEIALEDIENYTLAFPAAPAKKYDPSLDDETTGITNVKFSGMAPGTVINVYAPNGKLEGKVAADENGRVSTDLGSFGKGVHILRTPNGSIKVLNK
jgi:hypothetical protein